MFYSSYSSYGSNSAAQQAQSDATAAQADAREAKREIELMRQDIDRLLMITEALWLFLKHEHGYSDDDLAKVVTDIDLRDGRLGGKVTQQATTTCPNCGKTNTAKRRLCIYCGNPLPMKPFG